MSNVFLCHRELHDLSMTLLLLESDSPGLRVKVLGVYSSGIRMPAVRIKLIVTTIVRHTMKHY